MKNNTVILLMVCLSVSHTLASSAQNHDRFSYYDIGGIEMSFSLDNGTYFQSDVVGKLELCSVAGFRNCLIFDATIILIPDDNLLASINNKKEFLEGVDNVNGIEYFITRNTLNVLGEEYFGFNISIKDINENVGGYYSSYFYSEESGVLMFTHFYKVLDFNIKDRYMLNSYVVFSSEKEGLYSRRAINK